MCPQPAVPLLKRAGNDKRQTFIFRSFCLTSPSIGPFSSPSLGPSSCRNATSEGNKVDMAHWKKIAGGLTGISAGSRSNVWGVNANGQIYRFTNDDATPWHGVPGGLTDISAAA
ncbi:tectonin domain-containing protein, partial [Streptomyces roseolus]|uniref:tectonin domain-containing protein n=1 Tax=Streptomyces roseolus TaxID=67358 RepID=UPI0036E60598